MSNLRLSHHRLSSIGLCSILLLGLFLLPSAAFSQVADADVAEASCTCPNLVCGPCEVDDGIDFYSEKCGPRGTKTKSCKRPLCRPVDNQKACLSKNSSATQIPGDGQVETIGTTDTPGANSDRSNRSPASQKETSLRSADVVLVTGKASVIRVGNFGRSASSRRSGAEGDSAEASKLRKGDRVEVGDRILTGDDGRVRLRFAELSEIFVSPNSGIVVEEALIEKRTGPPKRTIIIDLKQGRVRSRVQGHYDDGESRFQIKTRSAVAGVRGTDFIVSFFPGKESWKSEVHTLSGLVCFGADGECNKPFLNSESANHRSTNSVNHAIVGAGLHASFVNPAPAEGAKPEEVDDAIAQGILSSVSVMTDEESRRIQNLAPIRFVDERQASANSLPPSDSNQAGQATCASPAGEFNQCSWTCEGNPKSQSKCRTDLDGVRCVRRLCRANGQWAEPFVLPKGRGQMECEPHRTKVKACGVYW